MPFASCKIYLKKPYGDEMTDLSNSKLLELFDNPTIAQISMFLMFQKELTAGQLAKLTGKNISTITRNLEKLNENKLINVSKIEAKGNLQVKFWTINKEIIDIDTIITGKSLQGLPEEETLKVIHQTQNVLISLRGILKTVYDYHVKSLVEFIQNSKQELNSSIFSVFLLDKDTGTLFEKEFKKFMEKFMTKHGDSDTDLDRIYSESIITFMLSARLGDILKPPDS